MKPENLKQKAWIRHALSNGVAMGFLTTLGVSIVYFVLWEGLLPGSNYPGSFNGLMALLFGFGYPFIMLAFNGIQSHFFNSKFKEQLLGMAGPTILFMIIGSITFLVNGIVAG